MTPATIQEARVSLEQFLDEAVFLASQNHRGAVEIDSTSITVTILDGNISLERKFFLLHHGIYMSETCVTETLEAYGDSMLVGTPDMWRDLVKHARKSWATRQNKEV